MVTASHLPEDKNGIKFFSENGGLDKEDIDELIVLAQDEATHWYNMGIMPPSSGNVGVLCSELVSVCGICNAEYVCLGFIYLHKHLFSLHMFDSHNHFAPHLSTYMVLFSGQLYAILQGNLETSHR